MRSNARHASAPGCDDPHDVVRIEVVVEHAAADRRLLRDDGVGVAAVVSEHCSMPAPHCSGGHHDVAVGGHVIAMWSYH